MLSLWKILANEFLKWKTYERVAREKLHLTKVTDFHCNDIFEALWT